MSFPPCPHPPRPNTVESGDGFYVSYNDVDTSIYGCSTTALVLGQMERFYILKGNHLAAYRELLPSGWNACLAYFEANMASAHRYSDSLTAADEVQRRRVSDSGG